MESTNELRIFSPIVPMFATLVIYTCLMVSLHFESYSLFCIGHGMTMCVYLTIVSSNPHIGSPSDIVPYSTHATTWRDICYKNRYVIPTVVYFSFVLSLTTTALVMRPDDLFESRGEYQYYIVSWTLAFIIAIALVPIGETLWTRHRRGIPKTEEPKYTSPLTKPLSKDAGEIV